MVGFDGELRRRRRVVPRSTKFGREATVHLRERSSLGIDLALRISKELDAFEVLTVLDRTHFAHLVFANRIRYRAVGDKIVEKTVSTYTIASNKHHSKCSYKLT